MPADISLDPSALSRPLGGPSTTPVLKSITVQAPNSLKATKTSQAIPARIDLQHVYSRMRDSVSSEQWNVYKEATAQFMLGRLNQAEYSDRIDPILANGEREHFHNQLLAAIFANLTREMPDPGTASWVSANDKPTSGVGAKPPTGDAAERRLKGEVMQLPSRDRRRIKDLVNNEVRFPKARTVAHWPDVRFTQADPYESMANMFSEHHRGRVNKVPEPAPSATGGLNKMNLDLEIRKRYAQPLAVESGEFPDITSIESRMLPFCYEAGLVNGHSPDASQLMTVATETMIKEFLTSVLTRTRSNGPGDSGSAGFGAGPHWVQTHKYRRHLRREEDALMRGELARDKSGLLPVEAKAASERPPLGMADLRLALEIGDCGISTFPIISKSVFYNYREGELEHYDDHTYIEGHEPPQSEDVDMVGATNGVSKATPNGITYPDPMDIDDQWGWEGTDTQEMDTLDNILDSCLAVAS